MITFNTILFIGLVYYSMMQVQKTNNETVQPSSIPVQSQIKMTGIEDVYQHMKKPKQCNPEIRIEQRTPTSVAMILGITLGIIGTFGFVFYMFTGTTTKVAEATGAKTVKTGTTLINDLLSKKNVNALRTLFNR